MEKNKKPFYFKWWFIVIVVIAIICLFGSIRDGVKKASDQKATYTWSDSKLASLIPEPDSKYGRISMENEKYFSIEIYKISKEKFDEYVEKCKDNGFKIDYLKQDQYYSADDKNGYSLRLSYNEKEKILNISLSAPEENSPEEKYTEVETNENTSLTEQPEEEGLENSITPIELEESQGVTDSENDIKTADDIRPEFKEALDGYEAFMNEYCEFMKNYMESDDIFSMTADYTKLMTEEIEWMEKMNNLEDEEMNSAELKYYTEVTMRVSQKLLEISQ